MEKAPSVHQDQSGVVARHAADAHVAASPAHPLLWPLFAAATASEAAASYFNDIAQAYMGEAAPETKADLTWTTPNRVALDLATVRLRDFSQGAEGVPTLLCAPFALHGATIADFAPGHSLVEALRNDGVRRLFVTDWRSAREDMRFLSIDNYLAGCLIFWKESWLRKVSDATADSRPLAGAFGFLKALEHEKPRYRLSAFSYQPDCRPLTADHSLISSTARR